jgi:hypothetical protein
MRYTRVMATYEDYRQAAALLWGEAGDFAAAEFARLNREHFAGSIPPMPVIIGLAPYGHCIGVTRGAADWLAAPRIGLAPEGFNGSRRTPGGARMVADVLVHEMIHAALMLRGENRSHNSESWCRMLTELSPGVLGREVIARPVLPRRVPNPDRETDPAAPKTIIARQAEPGALARAELAAWPHQLRPSGYYEADKPIPVPTY